MKVLFYSNLLEYTSGEKSYEIEGCARVRELIGAVSDHYGEKLKEFLLRDDTCLLLVNGKGIMMTGGLDTKLSENDTIEILTLAEAG